MYYFEQESQIERVRRQISRSAKIFPSVAVAASLCRGVRRALPRGTATQGRDYNTFAELIAAD
jgi:hypothetical protein